jgi:hypothetical protein
MTLAAPSALGVVAAETDIVQNVKLAFAADLAFWTRR